MLKTDDLKDALHIAISANRVPGIIGEAGIGKSQMVKGVAQELGAYFVGVNCAALGEGDMGLPILSNDKVTNEPFVTYAHHYALKSVQADYVSQVKSIEYANNMTEDDPYYNTYKKFINAEPRKSILFLDEYNRADTATRAELMNLILEGTINGFELPPTCNIVIAQNPSPDFSEYADSDYAVSPGDRALYDRVVWLMLKADLNSWLNFASKPNPTANGISSGKPIHPDIIEFVANNPEYLVTKETNDDCITATPRSWETASELIYSWENDNPDKTTKELPRNIFSDLYRGVVGRVIGNQLLAFQLDVRVKLPTPEEFFKGKSDKIPEAILKRITSGDNPRKLVVTNYILNYLVSSEEITATFAKSENMKKRLTELMQLLPKDIMLSVFMKIHERIKDRDGNFVENPLKQLVDILSDEELTEEQTSVDFMAVFLDVHKSIKNSK